MVRLILAGCVVCAIPQLVAAQNCPPVNFLTTPRIVPPSGQVTGMLRQPDGSFLGLNGPRNAPFLVIRQTPNAQNTLGNCVPTVKRTGSTPSPGTRRCRAGWAQSRRSSLTVCATRLRALVSAASTGLPRLSAS